jgi:NADP-dependent 3-hydroxy acid dehydrogenase YdfG
MLAAKGRVILISGANRGIGRAVAEALHEEGYSLSLGGRDLDSLKTMSTGWDSGRVHIARYDAQDWTGHRAWTDSAMARFVNCKGPLNLIHCALPDLEASGSGRIVNVASMSGKRVRNDHVAYNMTKHAMVALTHAARRIAWDKGVRATALCPSFVPTDMTAASTAMARQDMTQPADLARLVATVLALPNNASVAELLVNCRLEDTL